LLDLSTKQCYQPGKREERNVTKKEVNINAIASSKGAAVRTGTEFDPVRFEVIRNALAGAVDEMGAALQRSAYSTNIKTRADFSCMFFDRELRAVAQAFTQPIHLGGLFRLVPIVIREYGSENLDPGDGILTNHPFLGGVHLNDITLISPVFYEGHIFGYVASLAHHVDVGGGAPASIGAFQEVYQEGIIIPPIKLVKRERIDGDLFRFFQENNRAKHETSGDLRAQLAANKLGIRRVNELIVKYGVENLNFYINELLEYTERRTRQEIAKLPQGTYQAEGLLDDDGITDEPILLVAKITIEKDTITFDLAGTSQQRRAPMNSTYSQTFSSCAYFVKCVVDPDLPVNAGFYGAIRVMAPEGSVANATHPAAVVGGWEVSIRWIDVFFKAISEALPDRVCAGGKAMQCHAGFGGFRPGKSERSGSYYCFLETLAGGYGGRSGKDGPDAVQSYSQNTENAPIEETELNYPVRILRYELIPDSEGPGRFRGGLGLRRDYYFPDHEPTFTILADRLKFPPHGLFGGYAGKLAHYGLVDPAGKETALRSKVTFTVPRGSSVTMQTCGGGGYGAPAERDPKAVLKDVIEGVVSVQRASEIYGVVIDEAQARVNEEDTHRLRNKQSQNAR
jgi:N-methylhydantoinase B